MGDESPHQDDGFWSLAVNSDRPNRADRPTAGVDVPVDRVVPVVPVVPVVTEVLDRSNEATSVDASSRARTLRFVRSRGSATSTREAAASDQATGGVPANVTDQEKRAAAVVSHGHARIDSYRAQVETSRRKLDFWDVVTHPMVVAIGSLTLFSLIGSLWLRDPVVRPPAPAGGPLATAPPDVSPTATPEPATGAPTAAAAEPRPAEPPESTPAAVAAERPVATSGIAPADTASATASVLQVATRTSPAPIAPTPPPTASNARPSSADSTTTAVPARAASPDPALAPESTTASAASDAQASAAAPAVTPAVKSVPTALVAPPSVPPPAASQPRPEPIEQPATIAPPRAEDRQPPGAAPGAAGLREAVLVSGPLPRYPESVKRIGQAGAVDVDVTIDPAGRVTRAEALNGPSLLRGFAEDAVLKWRYEPALANGAPVESRRRVRIVFR